MKVAFILSFIQALLCTPMPQVQQQFQIGAKGVGNESWLGSDVDASVPLFGTTVMWVFGDTLIGSVVNGERDIAHMPRNSVMCR